MAEAVASARNATPTKEANTRSGSRTGRGKRATAKSAREQGYRFTGANTKGLRFERRWTTPGVHPYDEVTWELRDASISNESGKSVFEQKDVEVPEFWSQLATNVVVSKYFRGHIGTPGRERSVKQLIDRVVNTIASWAATQRYFATDEDLTNFKAELTHLLLHQKMAFNSPVWFNVGVEPRPQCSACFINSVEDSMSSIMDLAKTEAMLFKYGSGAGVNLSSIRGSKEKMSGGGVASGPVSFMKGFDAFAGVVKSGGKTRRAAKMVILDSDHPDVLDFVDSKASEERKAWALIEAGYDPSFTGEAYASVFFQNANHSVRASDDFMTAVEADSDWTTREVTTGEPAGTYKARTIYRHMAEAAWICGDPGIQYDTTINDWNPVANTDRQYATNPCSEFSFLNDTSCNLASLNLMKFVDADGEFDAEAFRFAARLTITAQEYPGRQRVVPDRADRGEFAPLPSARTGLRQPGRPADEPGPCLRLGPGPHLRRRHHRDHDRRGLSAVSHGGPRPWRGLQRLCRERGALPARHRQAPRRRLRARRRPGAGRPHQRGPRPPGTRRSRWARSMATATPRSACSRPPGPSPS